ncbi:hypothetical protein [Rurimicrobium arvi]|uniref:Lipoprotein n=1 Tax=Rurimicrobium arvi TaxID=2049916 RepID=A0ABP8MW99_9BACT
MKKTIIGLFVAVTTLGILSLSTACNKDKGNYNKSESTQALVADLSFQVPLIPAAGEYDNIQGFDFMINMDSFVKSFNKDYTLNSIQSVKLKSCILTSATADANNNFRNFHMANLCISSAANGNLLRIAVANDIVDTAAYTLSLPTWYDPNLASYFKCDSIRYRFYGNTRRAVTVPLNCKASLQYEMILAN